ncbi:MAG: hypothetical protein FWC72_08410, partial [Oscillospiraceae bacterium]|nr:hypothetical protein [Oscillospiraceae bacterium]
MACRNRLMMLLGFCLAILFLVGCNAIIEGTHTNRWPHEPEPTPAPPGEYITVSAVAELELGIWNLVSNQLENGLFRIVYPDPEGAGVILTDAIMDVQLRPLVAYAVGGGGITPVILAERPDLLVEIRVHYQKEPEQIAEVRTVHVPSTAITFLEEMLRYDALYLAMLVPARVADVNFVSMVYDFYYSHPLVVIRRPAVDVNLYPSGGGGVQRIVEIELDFGFSPEELSVMRADLLEAATDLL